MSRIYQYAILRYRPFSETGEFANIGVVALDVAEARIAYELAPKRFLRVRHFFDNGAHEAYGAAIEMLQVELGRVSEFLPARGSWSAETLFKEITRQRESSIVFSEVRALQSASPLDMVVNRLFGRYIRREFSAPQSPENILTKDIRKALHFNGMKHFKQIRIEDEVVPIVLPLAFRAGTLRAIKPLSFSQRNPLGVLDYGAHWKKRLSYLFDKNKIEQEQLLLAIDGPDGKSDDAMQDAYKLALEELSLLPFRIVDAEPNGKVNDNIISFAREIMLPQHQWIH